MASGVYFTSAGTESLAHRRKSGFTLGVIAGDPSRENIETQEVDPSTTRPEDFTADQREAFNTGINQE